MTDETPQPIDDSIPIHELTPEQASFKLDALAKEYDRRIGRDVDSFTAGEQHAADALKGLAKEQLKIDDPVDAALTAGLKSGEMVPFGEEGQTIASAKLQGMVDDLREVGLSDGSIKQALLPERHVEDPAAIEAAAQMQGSLLGNKEWVRSLLEGDREKFKQLVLLETVLMTPAGKAKT